MIPKIVISKTLQKPQIRIKIAKENFFGTKIEKISYQVFNIFGFLTKNHYRSLLWVGPALLFSTTTAISVLGWDGKVRTILSSSMPNAVLIGTLNDRLLLANPTEINPRQKKGLDIKHCLVGLLEPLLIGFGTMQQNFEQKLDLSEILYQITSRFHIFIYCSPFLKILTL